MRKIIVVVGLFAASAAFAVALCMPRVAQSGMWTVSGDACWMLTNPVIANSHYPDANVAINISCPLPHNDSYPVGSLSGVYFDFYCPTQQNLRLEIMKFSYSGTRTSDSMDYTCPAGTNADVFVPASHVKQNADSGDYLSAWIENGVGLRMTGVTIVN